MKKKPMMEPARCATGIKARQVANVAEVCLLALCLMLLGEGKRRFKEADISVEDGITRTSQTGKKKPTEIQWAKLYTQLGV